jgi:NADPH:quinone reductase
MSETHDLRAHAQGEAIRVDAKAEGLDALQKTLRLKKQVIPELAVGEVLIEVHASGINQSDVKAVLGAMPHAVWPRTPGRDYGGVVVEGPAQLLGREVWGSGGELGIRRDGAHARYLVLDAAHVREKPANLSLAEAGAIGVPFVTAYEGLREAGFVKAGDVVLVLAANGKVGQAAVQLATAAGARVFGVERKQAGYRGHASGDVTMFGGDDDWDVQLRLTTDGHGADIVFNTVGSPYFEKACRAMALCGRQIFISTFERSVPFDIFAFYRGRHRFIGIDTLALSSGEGAEILEALRPGFESRALRPFPVLPENKYALVAAAEAYKAAITGAPDRIVLEPWK